MKDKIEIGDIVTFYYTDDQHLTNAKVLHIPVATGDMWHLEKDGELFYVNPSCSKLDLIKLIN